MNNAAISGMEKDRADLNEKDVMRMADYTESSPQKSDSHCVRLSLTLNECLCHSLEPCEGIIRHFLPAFFADDEMIASLKFLKVCD